MGSVQLVLDLGRGDNCHQTQPRQHRRSHAGRVRRYTFEEGAHLNRSSSRTSSIQHLNLHAALTALYGPCALLPGDSWNCERSSGRGRPSTQVPALSVLLV